ncbi:hypothetical protein V8D89_004179 [Ganoderma adspersum]
MPRIQTIALSKQATFPDPLQSQVFTDIPALFPSLKAMILEDILFVPTHVLPQLTHLHLGQMEELCVSEILDLLRNTPALEVLDISPPNPFITPPRSTRAASSSVALHHLHDLYVRNLTSTIVHHLVAVLDVPSLAFLDLSSIYGSDGTMASMPLIPSAVTTWKVNRLAVDLKSSLFRVMFRGDHVSLDVGITTFNMVQHEEKWVWLRNDLPMILSLSDVEELHFQTRLWDVPASENLLAHLAPYMPAVTTLIVKHDASHLGHDDDPEGVTCLAQKVAGILASDRPVLFPNLVHLELIVSDIPVELCQYISYSLARRDEDGRRLQKLRIRVDERHSFRWKMKWVHEQEPEWEETGIFDHVDSGEIFPKRRGHMRYDDYSYRDDDTDRLGWGKWKDCMERAQHDYWQE